MSDSDFNGKRYDLAKVGRYKINKKLGTTEAFDQQTLTIDDIVAAIRYIVALHDGKTELETPSGANEVRADDIDHFGNRRMHAKDIQLHLSLLADGVQRRDRSERRGARVGAQDRDVARRKLVAQLHERLARRGLRRRTHFVIIP